MNNSEDTSNSFHSGILEIGHPLRMILELSTDAILIKDTDSRYLYINPTTSRNLGRSPEDVIGKTDSELLGEEVGQRLRQVDLQVMQRNTPISYEDSFWLHGVLRTFSTTKMPYVGKDGQLLGVMVVSQDITERKLMEESLLESEERFRKIFELSPDGVVVLDADARTIIDCNTAFCRMNGYQREELINQSIDILRHDKLSPEESELIASTGFDINQMAPTSGHYTELLKERGVLKFVTYHTRKDGSVFPVEISTTLIPLEGRSVIVGFDRDITDRVRYHRERVEARQLETALNKEIELHDLKTKMMERVSHEFRTPLSLINTSSEFLLRYNERMTQEQRTDRVLMIRTQVSHLAKMLDGIASVVYDQLQQPPLRMEMVNLDKLCLALIDHASGAIGVERTFEYQPAQAGLSVYTDEFSLSLILINVLSNAVKYSPPKSLIRVETDLRDQSLIVRVKDRGIGILANEAGRIFEPFYRGSNFDERPGLGIGLTIVRNAVNALGGSIQVHSQPESGSEFVVTIPVQSVTEPDGEFLGSPSSIA